jgi:hypothetical protein
MHFADQFEQRRSKFPKDRIAMQRILPMWIGLRLRAARLRMQAQGYKPDFERLLREMKACA